MNAEELRKNLPDQFQDVQFDDRLSVFGLATGAVLVLVGLATIAGTPWSHKASVAAAALQVVGALATIGIGAGLVWLTATQR